MTATSVVTLSNENGPSRSRPYQESRPRSSGAQWPACAPRRPNSPTHVGQLDAGRP
jgi:hypothetical protein